ncbi:hypothetical protein PV08_06882 [Exophiala spinifera]|uniref:Enoyl reductase (ER) domain-containing protein n=1 Tax=Exophiala spinifera TaxID=91928 RepID=A0A0D1YGI0_9EURO|nr:uncharacterized protein PV08_06882 [Exophiala spinifera]KIW14101.1 hypothetical protein PV08_06882 [Exophiala spinifera]
MRGWIFTSRGRPSQVLKLRDDLRKPTTEMLGPNDALVKISCVSAFQGFAALMGIIPHFNDNPWIPGSDFSGVIEAVGSDVRHLKAGDAVFGSPNPRDYLKGGEKYNGVLVEYAVIPADQVVRKPANISFEEASGVAGNGCTALQFCELAGLKQGDRVLITAGSSGLGSTTIQIVRSFVGKEGTIVSTCSAANIELVKGLGADEVIDYTAHPRLGDCCAERFATLPFDAIIDNAGTDDSLWFKCARYLKPDGIFIPGGKMDVIHKSGGVLNSVSGILSFVLMSQLRKRWPVVLGGIPRRYVFHSGNIDPESLRKVPDLMETGMLRGLVDSEWAMGDAIKAYERVATGRARGKVVIHVQDV